MKKTTILVIVIGMLLCNVPLVIGIEHNFDKQNGELISESLIVTPSGKILYVGGTGPGNYTNIQDAINNASDGDTVFVYNGIYPGGIIVDKSIVLKGEDRNATIIDGDGIEFVVYVSAVFANINGFKIINGGYAIALNSINSSGNNIISNNNFTNNIFGVVIDMYSDNNIISENIITNGLYGIGIGATCNDNLIYHNNFINITYYSSDTGTNIWNDSYPSGGNYWDDYTGVDENADGIGDTPYEISWGDNKDYYPFMEPNGWINEKPSTPLISGPSNGKTGTEYNYTFVSTDPEEFNVYYYIDWDDGSFEEWIGPNSSGEVITVTHTWSEDGAYDVRAKAKDARGLEGDWSTLTVTMPVNQQGIQQQIVPQQQMMPLLRGLLTNR